MNIQLDIITTAVIANKPPIIYKPVFKSCCFLISADSPANNAPIESKSPSLCLEYCLKPDLPYQLFN